MAEANHRVYTKGLTDYNLQMGVKLRHDNHLLFKIVEVHDNLVVEVEFLSSSTVNILLLDKVVQEEHKWTVVPIAK